MRILLVEDDNSIGTALKKGLEQESFAVDLVGDGTQAFDLAVSESFDLIILDWMLPGIEGLQLCTSIRKENIMTPILMLTAKGQIDNKVEGLNAGADDYLVKPFEYEELLARVKALLRRPKEQLSSILTYKDLIVDTLEMTVYRHDKQVNLSKKEFALLEFFMRNPERLLSKDQCIQHVWEYDSDVLPNTVEVYVGYLRNKIDKAFSDLPSMIQTVRGFGYKLQVRK